MAGTSFIGHVCITAVLLVSAVSLSAADDGPVTPYGDHCGECTTYGTVREPISLPEAMHALKKYYELRGCEVGILRHKGRFIEAGIYREGKQVDKVIFDRRTGRLRSIY
jgi:hypothetical protein